MDLITYCVIANTLCNMEVVQSKCYDEREQYCALIIGYYEIEQNAVFLPVTLINF